MTDRRLAVAFALTVAISAVAACSSVAAPPSPPASVAPTGKASQGPATLPVDAAALGALLGPWSPTPVPVDGGVMGIADRVCRSIHGESLEAYELQIVDARGAAILNAFYVGMAGGNFACENLLIDSFGQLRAEGFGSGTDPSEGVPKPAPDEVIAWYGTHQEAPRSMITSAGLVGSNVAEVRFTADGKPDIVATVMNGWFAAWLPDDWPRLTLRGYDAEGLEVFTTLDW